ncbi:hypothetical protein MmiEs2_15590 [Methanimicrococcus stummii]|uniref:Uncharacterized protein n=2 Tax=Methanimicrococcus stummii TaxID=3028294 RepID=A0AA96ZZJ1_9EURY|nr:hypothetical protein MmiEs2_15590 [Methanimicrococcus sp. Es2]
MLIFAILPIVNGQEHINIEDMKIIQNETFNEYTTMENLYVEVSKKSDTQLKNEGLTKEQIKQIKNYKEDFNNHIYKLNETYTDDQLKKLDYTDEQIKIIRNYDGSPESAKAVAAGVTIGLSGPAYLQQESNGNLSAVLSYTFSWSTEPYWKGFDGVGIGASGYPKTVEFDNRSQYTRATVNFYAPLSGRTYTENYTMNISAPGYSAHISSKFPMKRSSPPINDAYGKTGSGSVLVRTVIDPIAVNQYIKAQATYGHQYVGGSFSIGIGNTGIGLSFTPSLVVDDEPSNIKTINRR